MNSAIDAVNPCIELRPAIGPISPGGEETGERNPAQEVLDRRRVVVGDPEHPPPTPVAGEQQRANRTPGQLRSRPLDGQAQILVCPQRVPDLELHRRADLENLEAIVFDRGSDLDQRHPVGKQCPAQPVCVVMAVWSSRRRAPSRSIIIRLTPQHI
jgi:hypothetical protein